MRSTGGSRAKSNLALAAIPLMAVNAREHAFYLQYENRKTDFFEAIWRIRNWPNVAPHFEAARKPNLALPGVSG